VDHSRLCSEEGKTAKYSFFPTFRGFALHFHSLCCWFQLPNHRNLLSDADGAPNFVNEAVEEVWLVFGRWITVDCATKRVKAQNTANFPLAGGLHCTFTHCTVGFKC
jgi:hypothetical protein